MLDVSTETTGLSPDGGDLVDACRTGDEVAWRALFREHHPYVARIARRLGTPEDEIDDVVQRCFMVVHRKLDDFEGGRFTTWLNRIVSNTVHEHHRRRRVRLSFHALLGREVEPDAPRPDTGLEARQRQEAVRQVIARMTPKKRDVFVLYELEGLDGETIAELLGCKVETVRTRLHYARKEFVRLARRAGLGPEGSV